MKKILAHLVTLCVVLPCLAEWKYNPFTRTQDYYEAAGSGTAADTSTDTTNFDNNLSSADDTVQKALDTIDNLSIGAGGVTGVGDCVDGACLDGSSDGGTYIRLYDGDSNYGILTPANLSAERTITIPDSDQTIGTATTIAAALLVTEGEGIAANDNDTTVPTSAAVKDYADTNDDTGTDDQTLSLDANSLSIEDGNSVDLSGYLDNTDAQDLTLTGNTLAISGDPNTDVDLSGYLDNTDAQDLSLTGNTLSLTGDATSVDLSGYLDNTDDQTCAEVDGCVEGAITDITGESLFDLSDVSADPNADRLAFWDDDPGAITWADPATYLDNTDAQDLTLVGNTLAISGDPNTDVDLSGYLDNTDTQDLSLDANTLSLTDGGSVDLSGYLDDTTLSQEQVEDYAGAMVSGNTETLISVDYQDDDGTIDFVVDNDLANYSNANSAFLTSESDPNALLTAGTDNVKDTHIDWGTGASQVSADDIPDGATNAIPTLTQEGNWDTAYGWGDHSGAGYLTAETNALETDGASGIADTEIFIGTGAGTGNYAAMSGDATMANNGVVTVANDSHTHVAANISDANAGTDITADLEEETHASEHAVSAADTVFPADPGADRYLMWDDDPGALVWSEVAGGSFTDFDTDYGAETVTSTWTLNNQLTFKTDRAILLNAYTDEGIEAAQDALNAAGGTVIFPPTSDTVNAVLTIDQNYTTFTGMGLASVIDASTTAADIVDLNGKSYNTFSNLRINGNSAGGGTSTSITDGAVVTTDNVIINNYFNGGDTYGIRIDNSSSHRNKILNNTLANIDQEAIFVDSQLNVISGNIITGGDTGIEVDGSYNSIMNNVSDSQARGFEVAALSANVGNIAYDPSQYGFIGIGVAATHVGNHVTSAALDSFLFTSDYNAIIGNTSYYGGNGNYDFRLQNSDYCAFIGNIGYSNGGDAEALLFADNVTYSVISGNVSTASHEEAGLVLDTDAEYNVVIGNYFAEGITDNGVSNIIMEADPANNKWIFWDNVELKTGMALTTDTNIKSEPKHLRFTVVDPYGTYAKDTQICVVPAIDAAITVTKIEVTCDADPATEPTGDLKYADAFIGLANPVVINTFDTTNGALSDSTITSGSVAAGKCIYIQFDAQPDSAITQMSFDITYDYD